MNRLRCFVVLLGFAVVAEADVAVLRDQARVLRDRGEFKAAAQFLSSQSTNVSVSADQRKLLAYEADLLERIRQDYSLTEADLFARLEKAVRNLTRAEFEQWRDAGWFDGRKIDGETRYVGVSVSNLFFRHPELASRRLNAKDESGYQRAQLENSRAIRAAADRTGQPYVGDYRFRVTMSVTVASNRVAAGQPIRAWFPLPRAYAFQQGPEDLKASAPILEIAPASSPIRSAYFEFPAATNGPSKLEMTYRYSTKAVRFPMKSAAAQPASIPPDVAAHLGEAPHVKFTDKTRSLAASLTNGLTSKIEIARAFYRWISTNIQYSYALEYSTIPNISDYCLTKRYGDCGQEALLFMTLCRQSGIPARWQSGWATWPGQDSIHDWCEIWLAPYGWVPVDPYKGIYAMQYATSLSPSERAELADFYFGGLDQYRMAANSEHNAALSPAKQSWRSDDVDFQRGELEAGGKNLYFDAHKFAFTVEELPKDQPAK